MAIISLPVTFTAHTQLLASQLNSDFTTIYNDYNGNIDTTNLSATAGIVGTQLADNTVGNTQLDPTVIQHVRVALSSANILAMYGAPVVLIAAPGANKNLIIHKVLLSLTTTATQYANGGAVTFQLGNTVHGAGTATTATIAAGVINAAAGTSFTTVIPVSYTSTANTGLYISNDTAAFITGTGSGNVDIWYSVV